MSMCKQRPLKRLVRLSMSSTRMCMPGHLVGYTNNFIEFECPTCVGVEVTNSQALRGTQVKRNVDWAMTVAIGIPIVFSTALDEYNEGGARGGCINAPTTLRGSFCPSIY